MAVVGGLVFIAVVALIVVIIIVVCCLTAHKRKMCNQKEYSFGITPNTAYTIATRDSLTLDQNNGSSSHSSVRSSEPYYDYIMNSIAQTSRMEAQLRSECQECDGTLSNRDSMLQDNVAYDSHENEDDNKSEEKLLSDGVYVICIR